MDPTTMATRRLGNSASVHFLSLSNCLCQSVPWRLCPYPFCVTSVTQTDHGRPPSGRAAMVCLISVFSLCTDILFYLFPDVRDVFGIRGAQAWESTFGLLRMNVQGCHTILAICFTYRVEDHDGFRPGAPSHFSFLSLYLRLRFNLHASPSTFSTSRKYITPRENFQDLEKEIWYFGLSFQYDSEKNLS